MVALGIGLVLAVGAAAGCGSSHATARRAATSATPTSELDAVPAVAPRPAGSEPSDSARMVCAPEAQADVAESLGVKPTEVTPPTWVDHLYSCTYVYPNGSFTLDVKELSSAAQTTRWFDEQATRLGRLNEPIVLGQGAFLTTNGSAVVRKDWKVLTVDVSRIPPEFGAPPQDPTDTALSVAAVVMGCWTGA